MIDKVLPASRTDDRRATTPVPASLRRVAQSIAVDWSSDALSIAVGTLITLCVSGYQFGRGNHTVYLLEGLRLTDPALFHKDWFVTSTLQYHAIFSYLTAALMKLGIVRPAFLAGYLLIAIFWHIAWLRFTAALGGSRLAYLTSVVLYYVSAAGIALGVYQFLQDSCFLPSNVSNVAMLWGFYFWVVGKRTRAGLLLGIAGLFHLNYALVATGAWIALCAWQWIDTRRLHRRDALFGSLLVLAPSAFNIVNALRVKLRETGSIPLDQFVQIYVHFRHTHHFDPLAWPIALWVAFLWPIPLAVVAWRRTKADRPEVLRQTARIFVLMIALQAVAFVFAGMFYVSESLVQMMLWRFSIYVKMLSCIGAAMLICLGSARVRNVAIIAIPIVLMCVISIGLASHSGSVFADAIHQHIGAIAMLAVLSWAPVVATRCEPHTRAINLAGVAACAAIAILAWSQFGLGMTPETVDADYMDVCGWARQNTPVDAVFLVPPGETVFRLEARRAIVVNFKHVPQLSGEIMQWRTRLCDVLGTDDLRSFPHDYPALLAELDRRFEARPASELFGTADANQARYIVVDHDLGERYHDRIAYRSRSGRYFVYDRAR